MVYYLSYTMQIAVFTKSTGKEQAGKQEAVLVNNMRINFRDIHLLLLTKVWGFKTAQFEGEE